MTPQNLVTIGKCACGHSRAAHVTKLGGCGFCSCLLFHLDEVVQEVKPPTPHHRRQTAPEPPKAS